MWGGGGGGGGHPTRFGIIEKDSFVFSFYFSLTFSLKYWLYRSYNQSSLYNRSIDNKIKCRGWGKV